MKKYIENKNKRPLNIFFSRYQRIKPQRKIKYSVNAYRGCWTGGSGIESCKRMGVYWIGGLPHSEFQAD